MTSTQDILDALKSVQTRLDASEKRATSSEQQLQAHIEDFDRFKNELEPARVNSMRTRARFFAQIDQARRRATGTSNVIKAGNEAAHGANVDLDRLFIREDQFGAGWHSDFEFLYGLMVEEWETGKFTIIRDALNIRCDLRVAELENRVTSTHIQAGDNLAVDCDRLIRGIKENRLTSQDTRAKLESIRYTRQQIILTPWVPRRGQSASIG